jgi:hypothetical protein
VARSSRRWARFGGGPWTAVTGDTATGFRLRRPAGHLRTPGASRLNHQQGAERQPGHPLDRTAQNKSLLRLDLGTLATAGVGGELLPEWERSH